MTSNSQPPDPEPDQEQTEETGGHEAWKEEYEQHLTHWRAENAVAREKAEQERERWRLLREQEQEQDRQRQRDREAEMHTGGSQRKDSEWETVTSASNISESVFSHAEGGGRGLSAMNQAASAVHDTPPRYTTLPVDARNPVTREMPRALGADPIEVRNFRTNTEHTLFPTFFSPLFWATPN